MQQSSKIFIGLTYVIISATADAALPIFGKAAYHMNLGPASILFLRNLFAFVVLSLYGIWRGQSILTRSWLVYFQGVLLIAQELLFFYAMHYLDASIGTIVFYTYPMVVSLLAIFFFHEKVSLPFFAGLFTAITGVILISGLSSTNVISTQGLLLAFMASILFACFSILGQRTVVNINPFTLTASFSFLAMVFLSLFYFPEIKGIIYLNSGQVLLGCGSALLNSIMGMVFFLKAINCIGASKASLACTIEPVISIIMATIFFKESLSAIQWLGTLLVILSILLSLSGGGRRIKKRYLSSGD
jgi:DME family drug/metabolite transporter